MNEIDKVWKEFGDNVKNISIEFNDSKWRIAYKEGTDVLFVVKDDDMTNGAKKLLEWYKDSHTFRRAAENMWLLLDHIANEYGVRNTELYEICEARLQFITRNVDGELVWAEGYEESKTPEPKHVSHLDEPQQDRTSWVTAASTLDAVPEVIDIVPDGFPNYFVLNTTDLTKTECYGYVNGERMHVIVNHISSKDSVIEPKKPASDLENISSITESIFNSYYDEASAGIQSAMFTI